MVIKHKNLLLAAAITNVILGLFLFSCGILEFANILQTSAHNVTQTIGIHVSYLVFVSGALILLTGGMSVLTYNNTMRFINLLICLAVISLAWPLFLSISLFFTKMTINIRLAATVLTSLFYVVSVLIVKISNNGFEKKRQFNPSVIIARSGKRSQSIQIGMLLNKNTFKNIRVNWMKALGNLGASSKLKHSLNLKHLLNGHKRRPTSNHLARFFTVRHRPPRRRRFR